MNLFKKGFTLLELLVVISIIGILLAVGSVSFTTAQKKSRDSRRKADLKAIQQALEECYAVDGSYPTTVPDPGVQFNCTSGESVMQTVPADPKDDTVGYIYTYDSSDDSYSLCADLEGDGAWGDDDDDPEDECVTNLQ